MISKIGSTRKGTTMGIVGTFNASVLLGEEFFVAVAVINVACQ